MAAKGKSASGLEPNPDGVGSVFEVQVRTLDDVLEEVNPTGLHVVSLDVEGFELQVLRGFSLKSS